MRHAVDIWLEEGWVERREKVLTYVSEHHVKIVSHREVALLFLFPVIRLCLGMIQDLKHLGLQRIWKIKDTLLCLEQASTITLVTFS